MECYATTKILIFVLPTENERERESQYAFFPCSLNVFFYYFIYFNWRLIT